MNARRHLPFANVEGGGQIRHLEFSVGEVQAAPEKPWYHLI